jgi:hypothetical protein
MPDDAATGTITVKIPFLGWTGRASLEVQIPANTEGPWRLRAALEIAVGNGASLVGARLDGARLDGASLDGARLDGASLDRASLVGARLVGARLDGASLVGARLVGARLDGARLDGASLDGARLDGARLDRASLVGARLVGARLDGASLDGARLVGASLDRASLDGARLDGARLDRASLDYIRNDFWDVLLRAQPEIPGLLAALREGRIDGSTYTGDCACLAGTIANIRCVPLSELGFANSDRPIERWFLGIRKGDTPATNQHAMIVEAWIAEFQSLAGAAG